MTQTIPCGYFTRSIPWLIRRSLFTHRICSERTVGIGFQHVRDDRRYQRGGNAIRPQLQFNNGGPGSVVHSRTS
ncbi:hypothetical protein IE4872_CH02969 [Rhizobium gallicum]|uniref:Uncharacterized protein n=1 Tax=Rhizobium gallicum TaxID=56730 RepID=A0A1L5NKZ6_9HYPH|nr:hypothetical protein IE4872_CH02969 [Rhizobium gallicum]